MCIPVRAGLPPENGIPNSKLFSMHTSSSYCVLDLLSIFVPVHENITGIVLPFSFRVPEFKKKQKTLQPQTCTILMQMLYRLLALYFFVMSPPTSWLT